MQLFLSKNIEMPESYSELKIWFAKFWVLFSEKRVNSRMQRDFLERNKNKQINKFKSELLKKKINYPSNGTIFFSYSISDNDLNYLINSFKYSYLSFET